MQGELFTADIIPFPSSRRADVVRQTAHKLLELQGTDDAAADRFWNETCTDLLSGDQTARDLREFASAVHAEMLRHAERRRA